MSYKEVFEKDGQIIIMEKDIGECREIFITRAYFVLRNLNIANIKTVINKSYLYVNMYIHKLQFDKTVENSLNGYDCTLI